RAAGAGRRRRSWPLSPRAWAPGGGGRHERRPRSLLVVPGLGVRPARRAAVLRDAVARRDVAELVAHQAHAHQRRRLPDRADAVLLVDQDPPDLARRFDALLRLLTGGAAEQLVDLEQVRILGLAALLAARGVPLGELRSHERLGRIDRDGMAREQVKQLGAAVVPDHDLVFVGLGAREGERALGILDVGLDADRAPVVGDLLAEPRPGQARLYRLDLEAQPLAIVGAQPEALGILLVEADLVEQRVGLLGIVGRPLLPPPFAREVGQVLAGGGRAGGRDAEPEGFVQLV